MVLSSRRIAVRLVGERGSARAGCEGRKEVSFLSARLILSEHLLAARPKGSSRGLERYGPAARPRCRKSVVWLQSSSHIVGSPNVSLGGNAGCVGPSNLPSSVVMPLDGHSCVLGCLYFNLSCFRKRHCPRWTSAPLVGRLVQSWLVACVGPLFGPPPWLFPACAGARVL